MRALLAAYVQCHLVALARLVEEHLRAGDSEVEERFKAAVLDAPHGRMTERMIPLLEKGGHFGAVSGLHQLLTN